MGPNLEPDFCLRLAGHGFVITPPVQVTLPAAHTGKTAMRDLLWARESLLGLFPGEQFPNADEPRRAHVRSLELFKPLSELRSCAR